MTSAYKKGKSYLIRKQKYSLIKGVGATQPSALNVMNASSVGKLVQLVTASRLILYHECQSPYFIFALFALLTSLLVKYLHSHPLYYLCYLRYFAILIRLAQRHHAHPLFTFCFPFTNSRIPSRTRSE